MNNKTNQPDFIFETSWEVCNKVGGIYTVLTTRAATMVAETGKENVLFIGPLLESNPTKDFIQDDELTQRYHGIDEAIGLTTKIGRWDIPGQPMVVLVDYKPLYEKKGELYFTMWEKYGIHGELGYGDYDDSCLFAIASAKVMQAIMQYHQDIKQPLAIFNEWTTGMGLLYTKLYAPEIATLFITHATSTGRSIAGNGKPLYDYMAGYNGDQMAAELHVECKHAVEKKAAHEADAFGTVSEVTNMECKQLLEKSVDKVLPNGFEKGFVPNMAKQIELRKEGRKKILSLAQTLYARPIKEETLIIATSGRSEYRNKGLDIYIDAMAQLSKIREEKDQEVIALILVPSWVRDLRHELKLGLHLDNEMTLPMQRPYITHNLNDASYNPIQCHLSRLKDRWGKGVYPIFIPAYLDGNDGIVDINYYDLLPALDLTLFPSYYEPWGYTPLESIAFSVPTGTTDKAGFGHWANSEIETDTLENGVIVLPRTDNNYEELTRQISETVLKYSRRDKKYQEQAKNNGEELSKRAYWEHFYIHYKEAYQIALEKHS